MMFKKLIETREHFDEWFDSISEDFFLIENGTERPENYPCVISYYSVICDSVSRDDLYYDFIYLSDFKK